MAVVPAPTPNLVRNAASTEIQPSPGSFTTNTQATTGSGLATSPATTKTPAPSIRSIGGAKLRAPTPTIDLSAEIEPLIASVPAHVGMVIALPDGSALYQTNANTLFESASLYKLAIMVEVYRQRDAGQLSFDDMVTLSPGFFLEEDSVYDYSDNVYDEIPVGTLLENMITLSSNVAATALLHLVGTDDVNATMESLGLSQTKILWYPAAQIDEPTSLASLSWNDHTTVTLDFAATNHRIDGTTKSARASVAGAYNVTSPGDMAKLFEELVNGTVISPKTSAEMLNLLSEQAINDRLPAELPQGTRVAHKTGDLDSSVHDVGVIYAPAGPIVVVVMSDEVRDRQAVVDLMRQVAHLAYQANTR